MKKLIFAIAATLVVLAAGIGTGCTREIAAHTNTGENIEVKVNREFVIAVDANPSTGYSWQTEFDAAVFELVSERYAPEKAEGLVGAGGTQYYRFKALKTGPARITLEYQRAWESSSLEVRTFNITVK